MTSIAYDAAYAPNLDTVKAKGAIAVNHYLTGIYAGTSTQPVDAHRKGLGSIITYEQGPSELVGLSRAGGREVGNRILTAARALGVPLDGTVAVYPSVDVNVATDRMDSCDPAYRGLRDVLGRKLSIRCYGEFDLIKHLHDQGLTDGPGWLAGATSWSSSDHSDSPLVCMVQHVGSDIPSTDRNTVTQPDKLGAWWPARPKEDDMPTPADLWDAPIRGRDGHNYTAASMLTAAAGNAADAKVLADKANQRAAAAQAALATQATELNEIKAQLADLLAGKITVTGTLPATVTIGGQS